MNTLLRTDRLTVAIGDVSVCRDLALSVERGQCWAVLGRNGVGKTTLLHTLSGLRKAQGGEVRYNDHPAAELSPRERARFLGVVLQHDENPFPVSVRDSVVQGRYPHRQGWYGYDADDYAAADNAIARLDLTPYRDRLLHELSGGERRRVALATVFAQDPRVFVLDEPGAHLDVSHQIQFLTTLKQHVDDTGTAAILVIHDLHLATRFCDQAALLLGNGRYVIGATQDLLDEETLQQAFGHPIRRVQTEQGTLFIPR